MSEPENHTLHLLREIREDIQKVDRKVDRVHIDLKESIDGLVQTVAGEIAGRSYAAGGLERRLADIEKRLSALEQQQ